MAGPGVSREMSSGWQILNEERSIGGNAGGFEGSLRQLPKESPWLTQQGWMGAQLRLKAERLLQRRINNEMLQLLIEHHAEIAGGFSLISPSHLKSACLMCSHLLGKRRLQAGWLGSG